MRLAPPRPGAALDVHRYVRARWAEPSAGPTQVGIEQEWHTYCSADPTRRCTPEEILAAVPDLPGCSRVTVEPGGQVELATPPTAPWWDAPRVLAADADVLRAALADAGILALACGVDPFRPPWRTLRAPRYDAMERYLDGWGPAGRRMMCATAAIQVNVDLGAGDEPADRWRAAHVVGPAMSAAFAASPSPMARSERSAIWAGLDRTRTAPAFRSGDPGADWADYLLAARVLLVRESDGRCRPVPEHRTFARWLSDGGLGRPPGAADLDYHATTVFPPVRLRGWFELRWLDALPSRWAGVAAAVAAALIVDPTARAAAESACAEVVGEWEAATRSGPRDQRLAAAATTCLTAAAGALERAGATDLAAGVERYAARFTARGRCPADELEARVAAGAQPVDLVAEGWT